MNHKNKLPIQKSPSSIRTEANYLHQIQLDVHLKEIQEEHYNTCISLNVLLQQIYESDRRKTNYKISLLFFKKEDINPSLSSQFLRNNDIICKINEKTLAILISKDENDTKISLIIQRLQKKNPFAILSNNPEVIRTFSQSKNILSLAEAASQRLHSKK